MRLAAALLALSMLMGAPTAQSVSPQRLYIGMSAGLSGPTGEHGQDLARGLRLGFAQANAAGGVDGRPVELLLRDDVGDPERTLVNTRQLIDAGVLAFTGFGAAPEPVLAAMAQAGAPLAGIASGAQSLRDPPRPLVFNLRAGWLDEAAAMVLHLDTVGVTDIAVLSQDDALGRAGREGLRIEMARLALKPIAQAVVPVPTDAGAVDRTVDEVCRQQPQVLVLILDAGRAAAAMQQARRIGCAKSIYLPNEAGARLAQTPLDTPRAPGSAVVVAQVVPHPGNLSIPVVADFNRVAAAAGVKPGYANLEGYLYARVLVEALKRCTREPSRGCIATALEARPIDVGGHRVQFTPTDHRGSRFIEMTLLTSDGRFRR